MALVDGNTNAMFQGRVVAPWRDLTCVEYPLDLRRAKRIVDTMEDVRIFHDASHWPKERFTTLVADLPSRRKKLVDTTGPDQRAPSLGIGLLVRRAERKVNTTRRSNWATVRTPQSGDAETSPIHR